jgi:glycerophosphoryl diester phosphodiesterase
MHDRTIERTTDGSGTLSTLSYAQAQRHRLDDGSRIPGEVTFLDGLRRSGKSADMG